MVILMIKGTFSLEWIIQIKPMYQSNDSCIFRKHLTGPAHPEQR